PPPPPPLPAEDGIRDSINCLVGSEMCIRDRKMTSPSTGDWSTVS
ncbi:hypothetical protein H8943_18715, partial [Bacillus pumilus]|nr:hypothetical protein [Bacillus pumilus]